MAWRGEPSYTRVVGAASSSKDQAKGGTYSYFSSPAYTLSPGTLVTTQWRKPRPFCEREVIPSSMAITV